MRKIVGVSVVLALVLGAGCGGAAALRGVQSTERIGDAVWYVMSDEHGRALILRCVDDGHRPVCQEAER